MTAKLDQELKRLGSMTRAELVERWQAAYGCLPPAGARRELLMYAAGWHIQVKLLHGFSGDVRRKLHREVERVRSECRIAQVQSGGVEHDSADLSAVCSNGHAGELPDRGISLPVPKPLTERRKPGPGTRLFREWSGWTHTVDVMKNGYLYDGTVYRSLSAIARRITGAHWSGPRFFGL